MKAKELIAMLEKNPELELQSVSINLFLANKEESERRETMLAFAKVFGKLDKRLQGSEIYLAQDITGLSIRLWDYSACKIVGHVVKKRLVLKPSIPVDMIQVEEEYTVPVSDCQIENGEVKTGEVVFAESN